METFAGFLFLFLLSAGCWLFVFSKSARRKLPKGPWKLVEDKQEQDELDDGMALVGALIVAMVFTLVFLVGLIAFILS